MGQTLSEPVLDKYSSSSNDERLMYGSSCMQGWRVSMEDAHTTILRLEGKDGYSFFGVYDGHGGQNVAKYSGEQLHIRIARDEAFMSSNYKVAIKNGFLGIDNDLRRDPEYQNEPSGCTAVTALITSDGKVFVGNAGDSRAIISVDGVAKPLSYDHKPVNRSESTRIVAAGGFVEFGRVNGSLALSRAIGDFEFKQNSSLSPEYQVVTSDPEIVVHELTENDEFIVLACDGIWDCMTSEEVVEFIRHEIALGQPLDRVCESLMERCLAPDSEIGGVGCDNMTVIIVGVLNGKSRDEWYEKIKKKLDDAGMTDNLGNTITPDTAKNATTTSSTSPTSPASDVFGPSSKLNQTTNPPTSAADNSLPEITGKEVNESKPNQLTEEKAVQDNKLA